MYIPFWDGKDKLPPNFSAWMDNFADQIVYARENLLSADASITEKWSELTDYNPDPENMDNVNPLLTTNWDQGYYYNALCPVDNGGPGGHVYVGCVATAMGQIMKYHNYPDQGNGTHTYYCYPYGNSNDIQLVLNAKSDIFKQHCCSNIIISLRSWSKHAIFCKRIRSL
jgi:hypothetical protein